MRDRCPTTLSKARNLDALLQNFGLLAVVLAFVIMGFAGFVKGAVGFALPMITVSGIGSLMTAEVAIAAIILPAIATNIQQTFRDGIAKARMTLLKYWRIYLLLLIFIGPFAQLVVILPDWVLFIILGAMVSVAGTLQLIGWRPRFPPRLTATAEWIAGAIASFFGGLAGVWGPPILLYLLARETPKAEMVRCQGIAFLVGSLVLVVAHSYSGVLNQATLPFSALLVIPGVLGMIAGQVMQDRMNQERFRTLTLFVLVLAGLNLLRRGLIG